MPLALSGSLVLSGSISTTGAITMSGSIASASYAALATTASNANTSSYVVSSVTDTTQNSRLASNEAKTGSFATTGSNAFTGSQSVSGSLTLTGTITAQTLVVQTITSSVEYSSGSNVFGSNTGNTHQFTGSVLVSGSGNINGTLTGTNITLSQANTGGSIDNNAYLRLVNTGTSTISQSVDLVMRWQDGTYNGTGGISMVRESATARSGRLILQPIDSSGNNVLAMTLTSGGNIGIGTTNPTVALEISTGAGSGANRVLLKPTTDYAFYQINNTAGTTYIGTDNSTGAVFGNGAYAMNIYNSYAGNINFYTNSALRMSISSSGNIGIGTSSPSYQLDVNGTGRFSGNLRVDGTSNGYLTLNATSTGGNESGIFFQVGGGNKWENYTANNDTALNWYSYANSTIVFKLASTGAATFSSSLDVGTNIRTDGGTVQVGAGAGAYYTRLATVYNYPYVDSFLDSLAGASYDGRITFRIQRNGGTVNPVMSIIENGNVGIGTTAPSAKLDVRTGVAGTLVNFTDGVAQTFQVNTTSTGIDITNPNSGYISFSNTTERMRITSGGTLCVRRTTSPASAYSMAIQEAIAMYVNTNGNNMVNFFNASETYISSIVINSASVNYNTSSDYRLKTDLKSFNGLDVISRINVYDFAWKLDNTRTHGVLAHELQEVLPDAVSGVKDALDEDGNIKNQGVDYSKIVPILIKSIQELKAENDTLKEILQRNNIQ